MDQAKIDYYRSKYLKLLDSAFGPIEGKPTAESNEAAVQALCLLAATAFMTTHQIPYSGETVAEFAEAARDGLDSWRDLWSQRRQA